MTPEVFGEYLLTGRLEERSMAEVFLAVKLGDRSGQLFVVKRPPLGERASGVVAESLRREADVLRKSSIEGVVRLVDEGEALGLPFLVVEHVRGVPLETLLRTVALDPAEVALIGRDLARIIGKLHERGWVHGDISPSNTLVDDAGELTLIDFGLTRRIGEARETPAGKASYASPQAAMGKDATQSDDIYGWGVVIAECLLSGPLFRESELAEAATRSEALPSIVSEVPKLKEALLLEPRGRPSAEEILAAIEVPPENARASLAARVGNLAKVPASRPSRQSLPEQRPRIAPAVAPTTEVVAGPAIARKASGFSLRRRLMILGVAVVTALGIGFLVGQRSERRSTKTSLSLPLLPARSEIELDGKRMIIAKPGRPIPIEPGPHSLSISTIGKGEREYEFIVERGEHMVIVTLPLSKGKRR